MENERPIDAWMKMDAERGGKIVRNIDQIASDGNIAMTVLSDRMMAAATEVIEKLAVAPWQMTESHWGPRIVCPDWKMTRGVGTGDAWLELAEIGKEHEEGFSWISIAVGKDITKLGLEFVFRPGLLDYAEAAIADHKRIVPLLNLGMVCDEETSRLYFPIQIDTELLAKGFEVGELEKALAPIAKATKVAIDGKAELDKLLGHVRNEAARK